jgi:hypothetical protein
MGRWRVASGLVLLLVMLGLPVAPVVCDVACPLPASETAEPASHQVIASTSAAAPCHDAADTPGAEAETAASLVSAAGVHAAEHDCEHPPVLSAPRAPEALRVPEPSTTALGTSSHLSMMAASHDVVATRAAALTPAPSPGAFSPVLRI